MHPSALVLSADTSAGNRLAASLECCGVKIRLVTRWGTARQLIANTRAPVIICDAERPVAEPARVLRAGSQADGRVIVVARGLDSAHWLEYISGGAFDVLASPLDAAQLQKAVRSAHRQARASRALRPSPGGFWTRLRRYLLD